MRRKTLGEILEHMDTISDIHYDNQLEPNILEIFMTLSEGDRKTFLRKAHRSLVQYQLGLKDSGLDEVVIDDETRIDRKSIDDERKIIAEPNYEEQRRFKNWGYRIIFLVMLFFLFGSFFVSMFSATRQEDVTMLQWVMELLKMLFSK